MKKVIPFGGGIFVGLINGLLGAGGGMIAVPLLKHSGLDQNASHANSIAVILPLTVISAILYIYKGYVTISQALPFLPLGIAGSLFGTWLLPKIPNNMLQKIFGIFMLWAGIRMWMK